MEQKLSVGFKFCFALAELGFTTLRAAMDFFLLFYYTDVAGINPALAGSALLVGKLTWDAINDPLFGYFSDRTRSRFGRRRIYMLIAAVPLAIATWIQFSLPEGLTGIGAFLAVLLTFWLKDSFVTMAIVPYASLLAEVSRDYKERTSLALYKSANSVVGYILGAAGVTVFVGLFKSLGMSVNQAWSATGAIYGSIAMITLLITTLTIKEPPEYSSNPSTIPVIQGLKLCFKNKPFIILMAVFFMGSFAFTAQATLLPYLIQYQLGMANQTSIVLVISLATTGVFLIPAKLLSDRIEKGPTYAIGMGLAALTFLLAFFFVPSHPSPIVYVIAFVLGVGFSTHWVIPYAMMPDVIEYDEMMSGERREGIYYGFSNFLTKFAVALGVAVPGWVLNWFGYVPNAVQTSQALLGIRLFYALVPAVVIFLFIPLLIRYPITSQTHANLRLELAKRKHSPQKHEG
ncbi:MAG: MFS transporter [Anaerolineaceae bacterium]|nr:MFS transporter [Anaerolineaceae bacterium]